MKKIIAGKQYNTDTARPLAEYSNNLPREDFGHIAETLYVTKSGNYFIHGIGGAKTVYARSTGGRFYSGGEKIVPVTEEAAQKFVEDNSSAEVYERIWGNVDAEAEEVETIAFSTRITPEAKEKLDAIQAITGQKKGEVVTDAILEFAKKYLAE